eukprot:Anaeramoba_ignava/a217369_139.p2 GENE.a217369_139~~a217369_139.p2  ORF type:complete len:607 (+),score=127.59 a217369_139:3468-5288(+)
MNQLIKALLFLLAIGKIITQTTPDLEFKFQEATGDISSSTDMLFNFTGLTGTWLYPTYYTVGVNATASQKSTGIVGSNLCDWTQNCGVPSGQFTPEASVEIWFMEPDLPANAIFGLESGAGWEFFLISKINSSFFNISLQSYNGSIQTTYFPITTGFLNHLVVNYNKSENVSFYYNGSFIYSEPVSYSEFFTLRSGSDQNSAFKINSNVMYIATYSSMLSPTEIEEHFNASIPYARPNVATTQLSGGTDQVFNLSDIITLNAYRDPTNDEFTLTTTGLFEPIYGRLYTSNGGVKGDMLYVGQQLSVNLTTEFYYEGVPNSPPYTASSWEFTLFDTTRNLYTYPQTSSINITATNTPANPTCQSLTTTCYDTDAVCQVTLVGDDPDSLLSSSTINIIPSTGSIYQILSSGAQGSLINANDTTVDYRTSNTWSVIYSYGSMLDHTSQVQTTLSFKVTNDGAVDSSDCTQTIILKNFLQVSNSQSVIAYPGQSKTFSIDCSSQSISDDYYVHINGISSAAGATFYDTNNNQISGGSVLPVNTILVTVKGSQQTTITLFYHLESSVGATNYHSENGQVSIEIPYSGLSASPYLLSFSSFLISLFVFLVLF